MAVSFADDIRPLFRDSPDIDSMKDYGLDLSSYEQVKKKAPEIYACLKDGSMPCDEPWPNDEVALFKAGWMKAWCPEVQPLEGSPGPEDANRLML
jgi:hypothetical protein